MGYVDDYDRATYDTDYRSVNHNFSKWITVHYAAGTTLDVNIDTIHDRRMTGAELNEAMFGSRSRVVDGRLIPAEFNRSTTANLWAAKQGVLNHIENGLLTQIIAGYPALMMIFGASTTGQSGGGKRPGTIRPLSEPESAGSGRTVAQMKNDLFLKDLKVPGKSGQDLALARAEEALARFRAGKLNLPEGLTAEHLREYRAAAVKAIEKAQGTAAGPGAKAVQTARINLIDEILAAGKR